MTTTQFIASHAVRMTSEAADSNPNMDASDRLMNHWRCHVRVGRLCMMVPFSQGLGIQREPTVTDVLDCLASDAASVENARSFEEWASELGYDTDSRKAARIYATVERQAKALKRLLGDEAFNELLWSTERE